MTNPKQIDSDRVLVIGMGLTGYSVVRYLEKLGSQVTIADSREWPPYLKQIKDEFPTAEIVAGEIPYSRFMEFDRIVKSPGIELECKHPVNPELLIGDIELFVQQADAPVIAITGSNGKSTVTMLVSEMLLAAGLKVSTGGNIGTPVLELVEQDKPDFYVLELSSFQLETTWSLEASSATVLNISEDHMDRYHDLEDYAEAKKRILHNAENVVLNRQDVISVPWAEGDSRVVSFGLDAPVADTEFGVIESENSRFLARGETLIANIDQVTLQGDQNIANIMAAMALVESAGITLTPAVINAALAYGGLPHRCEIVSDVNGVTWINDSKGTNVGATVAAIEGFQKNIILIAGGKGKGADFSQLANIIRQYVDHTILFGEDADTIFQCLDESTQSFRAKSLEDAVNYANQVSRPGSVVLFSPACASFDMFDNYEHRGNVFKQLVWALVR